MKGKAKVIFTVVVSVLLILCAALLAGYILNRGGNKRNVNIQNTNVSENLTKYKTIGLIAGNMQDKSTADIFNTLRDYTKDNGNIKMLLLDSEAKADKQMLQLEDFLNRKVDGIIINPVEGGLPGPIINKLVTSGIPVISVNSSNMNSAFTCSINSSPERIGESQAEYLTDKLKGKGNILVLTGPYSDSSYSEKMTGFKKILGKYPGIEITEILSLPDKTDKSVKLLEDVLIKNKNINGIAVFQNDLSLKLQPLFEKLDIRPYFIGADTDPEVLEALKTGRLDASIYISSSDMAAGAYDTMMEVIKKGKVPEEKIIQHTFLTSVNIDEYIESNLNYKIK